MVESYKNNEILDKGQADLRAEDIAITVHGSHNKNDWNQGAWPENCAGDVYVNSIEELSYTLK